MSKPTPGPLRLLKLIRLGLHLLQGLITAAFVFPLCTSPQKDQLTQAWSRKLLAILKVRVQVLGEDIRHHPSAIFVANHISWLDIWLINSQCTCRFVSKSEVRDWPLMGWLAQQAGTLFIQRARRHHTATLNQQILAVLDQNSSIAMFPEGTTSDGRQLRRFFTSLLQPAADTGAPLVPAAIRYVLENGEIDLRPAFIDDMSLAESLKKILAAREIMAELIFLPGIETRNKTRRDIAHAAQDAIAAALNLPSPGTTPETAPDPQAA